MDEKKSGRWPELITIACTGWLLYSSIQQYQRMATVDIFTPAEWTAYTQDRHMMWVLYVCAFVSSCFRFLFRSFDERRPGICFAQAMLSTLVVGVWTCLWEVGFSEKGYMVLWAAALAFLVFVAAGNWRSFWKACREREMA